LRTTRISAYRRSRSRRRPLPLIGAG
jgi:hypothetical protein